MLCNGELYRLFHSGTIAPREFDIDAPVSVCVSKIDVVFIHRPALYWRGRAFMSGAMIDRCNANSAHHRAFITNPLSLSSLLWNRYILLTRNPVTSHAHFSLDNLVIYHPWRSRDRFSSTNKGISFLPLPHPDYSFLFLKNPFSLQFKTKNQIDSLHRFETTSFQ